MSKFASLRALCGVTLAALALAVPAVSQAQSGYAITEIVAPDGLVSTAKGINNSGQITGTVNPNNKPFPYAYIYANGVLNPLDPLYTGVTQGIAINDNGQVAEYEVAAGGSGIQYGVWTQGVVAPLNPLSGGMMLVYAINNLGQVAGSSRMSGAAPPRAVLWTNGIPNDLGTLGGASGSALSVNDSGQVTGYARLADGVNDHAFRYANGIMTDLGVLSGTKSRGNAINSSGQVAGYSFLKGNSVFHATLWNGTAITDIGALFSGDSEATSINAYGDVVGYSIGGPVLSDAFLYMGGRLIDLNTLVAPSENWQLEIAWGINDNGWIIGQGHHNGNKAAFLLKPAQSVVSGSLSLEGVPDFYTASNTAPLDTFHISFRAPGAVSEIYGADVAVTPLPGKDYATFALANIPPGQYDVAIKGAKSLRVVLPNITVGARVSLPAVHLLTGDANGDNSVDSTDFGLVIGAYGGVAGVAGSAYDASVDFNLDGKVDSSDFALMLGEFGNTGDL